MFYYCQFDERTPKEPFLSYKIDGELHPKTSSGKQIFIYGKGWKTPKGKGILIPLLPNLKYESVKSHIEEFGKNCTFYAITGYEIRSQDCCAFASSQEFNVATSKMPESLEYVAECVSEIKKVNQKIYQLMLEKYGIDMEGRNYQYCKDDPEHKNLIVKNDLFWLRPHYSLMAYFLTKPHLDVVSDDGKLWKHFVELYPGDKLDLVHEEKCELPIQMKARLEFLFNKEISEDYERIMNKYPMG